MGGTGHGAWGMRHGAWGMGHGAWGMGHGGWGMGHGGRAWGAIEKSGWAWGDFPPGFCGGADLGPRPHAPMPPCPMPHAPCPMPRPLTKPPSACYRSSTTNATGV